MADIRMRGVCKRFGKVSVIENVDLDIEDGEFAVFVGPSGCGKSTLLRLVAGLEDISDGEMRIGGKVCNDIPPSKRGVSMVFQSYALYPHMTVYENMAFGLQLAKEDSTTIEERVNNAAKILQLDHLIERLPKELSGGQRQRVAIGRAIVRQPGVFLFDEPLSNLDAALRVQTRIEIARLHGSMDASMVYVTHDQVEAMTLADKIVLLNAGPAVQRDGSVAQVGHPLELYHKPVNTFVAGFIGSPKMNFLPGELEEVSNGQSRVRLKNGDHITIDVDAQGVNKGADVIVGIRPEHFDITSSEQNALHGTVSYVEHLGESTFVYLQADHIEDLITVRYLGDQEINEGDKLSVSVPTHNGHLFNTDTSRAYERHLDPAAFKQKPPGLGG